MCADPSAPGMGDQAKWPVLGRARVACLVLLALASCGPRGDPLEAVRVAAGRAPTAELPPVPGADRPYPGLGSVPERPVPPSAEARRRIADALIADRENARHVGAPVMRPDAAGPPASAVQSAPLEAPPATPLGATERGASVPGAVAPLVPPPAPPAPPIAGAPAAGGPPSVPPPAPVPAPVRAALPDPPADPPPPAFGPTAARPASPPAASPAAPARADPSVIVDRSALPPPRAVRPASLPAGQGAALAFPPGSAALPAEMRAVVARFAAGRGTALVRVTGYRDTEGGDLALALARAQAVAQALRGAGTPAEAIELAAEPRPGPAGRGAEMRLVYSP
ncbi:MAG: hypothetical protein KatS3mg116_2335 [Elioraea sp.]|nr:MAG: hypothetical protein KatS3mg116_2335 [Elioraea sp.]